DGALSPCTQSSGVATRIHLCSPGSPSPHSRAAVPRLSRGARRTARHADMYLDRTALQRIASQGLAPLCVSPHRARSSETLPDKSGRFGSARPEWLSPLGSSLHSSKRLAPPQGRLRRPVRRQSLGYGGTDAVTTPASPGCPATGVDCAYGVPMSRPTAFRTD